LLPPAVGLNQILKVKHANSLPAGWK